jgi:hypothetical protein
MDATPEAEQPSAAAVAKRRDKELRQTNIAADGA